MRIVRTAEGNMLVDPFGRSPGRGAYVCRTVECFDKAINKGALARALKTPLPTDLRDALGESLTHLNMTIEGGARGQE